MIETALVLLVFPGAMAFAAVSDMLTMTIPNRITLALIVGFAVLTPLVGMPMIDILWHLGAGVLVLAIAFGFFAAGWIGGGDAKLAAASALWIGWAGLMDYAVYASVLGGLLTLAVLVLRRLPLPKPLLGQAWLLRLHDPSSGVPYGVALAAAGLLIYPETVFMRALAA